MKVPGNISAVLANKPATTVWSISPEATVFDAVKMMDERNIGALPVLEEGQILGMFSERDYTRKIILRGKTSKDTRVREIMATPALSVGLEETVDEALRLMTAQRVRHLPVIEQGKLVGIVSIGDLVNWVISSQGATIHTLQNYITGNYPG